MPLPAGTVRVGGRFAEDGHALLELITLNATAAEVLSTWKAAGWEVRPISSATVDDFRYLCVRGDNVVYAWSADEPSSIQNLMLVRTPNNDHSFGQEKQR